MWTAEKMFWRLVIQLVSHMTDDSRQRHAAGSQPAGLAAGGSSAGWRGCSDGIGRRCPAAAPETGRYRTSLRSRTLRGHLVAGCQVCRQVSPSVSGELRGQREEEGQFVS